MLDTYPRIFLHPGCRESEYQIASRSRKPADLGQAAAH